MSQSPETNSLDRWMKKWENLILNDARFSAACAIVALARVDEIICHEFESYRKNGHLLGQSDGKARGVSLLRQAIESDEIKILCSKVLREELSRKRHVLDHKSTTRLIEKIEVNAI